jgi:hypothetical protein
MTGVLPPFHTKSSIASAGSEARIPQATIAKVGRERNNPFTELNRFIVRPSNWKNSFVFAIRDFNCSPEQGTAAERAKPVPQTTRLKSI